MPKTKRKLSIAVPTPPERKQSLGETPAKLAKRELVKPAMWCPKPNLEYDSWCDALNPKTITFKDICKATNFISKDIPKTPLQKSKHPAKMGINLYFKYEIFNRTGSFHDRGAFYALSMLTKEQCEGGVYSSSLGNWALALACYGQKLKISINLVLPITTEISMIDKCEDYGATVILLGKDLAESKRHAFTIIAESGTGTYINGYDHPHVVAASGSIGLEILEQLPSLDAVIVPIGGGGLIAGIASAIKKTKPQTLVYGIEHEKSCCFFKALHNEYPYQTAVASNLPRSLDVPTAGYNAFHTAKSLIDKLVLVEDDCIARAVLYMLEEEHCVTEGAGAAALGALLAIPNILPELRDKTVVCVISGGNMNYFSLLRTLDRARVIVGRIMKVTVTMKDTDISLHHRILSIISNTGGNVINTRTDGAWYSGPKPLLSTVYVTMEIEVQNLTHACSLKRVLERLFPGVCEFVEEPFSPIPEDFDEFCDPDNPRMIDYADVQKAFELVKPSVIYTPCPPSKFQKDFSMKLFYKAEQLQTTGSFKERGSLNVLQLLPTDKQKIGVVIASIGNDAAGLCYHASKMGIPVIVVMPNTTALAKLQWCHRLGAKVIIQGGTLLEAQKYARGIARDKGLTYINGRDHPHVLAGYGGVALEILEQVPNVECVIVPVGTGGLAAATATVIKHNKPDCLVYGVESEAMPVFYKSLENQDPIQVPTAPTMADAIGVTSVATNSFANAKPLLDKMLMVQEDWIARSVLHLAEKERFVVEGAGAASLAALIGNLVPELKLKTVVCVLSGGNIDGLLLARVLDRALAAEGRLVKFSISIKDTPPEQSRLFQLLTDGGYNLTTHFEHHRWLDNNDTYLVEMRITCQCKDLEHALELKRIMDRAYSCSAVFDTEPFNDRRTCPCYIKKVC